MVIDENIHYEHENAIKGDDLMNNIRTTLFVLVSMIVAVIELTYDPTFYIGRIFLAIAAVSFVFFAVMFVKENWQVQPKRISNKKSNE